MSVELFWPDLSNLPPGSVVLQTGNWFSAVALQSVYSARPDVSVVHWPSLYQPDLAAPFVPERFPAAAFPKAPDGLLVSQYEPGFYSAFLDANLAAENGVYVQYSEDSGLLSDYLRPDPAFLLLARLRRDSGAGSAALQDGDYDRLVDSLLAYIGGLGPGSDPPLARKAVAYLYYVFRPVAGHLSESGRDDLATRAMEGFFERFGGPGGQTPLPHDAALNAQAFLHQAMTRLGRQAEALKAAEGLVALDPTIGYSHFLLALSRSAQGLDEEAFESMALAAEKDRLDPEIAAGYARMLATRRSIAEASAFLAERAASMRSGGLVDSARSLDRLAACLNLAPEIEEPGLGAPSEADGQDGGGQDGDAR
jgi:tetratricopeptide (TPR) repeat protein